MSQRRLLFVCYPDTNHPIGGVKQIYRQVELLHRAGWDAFVLQEQPGFRASWFEHSAPVMDLESYKQSHPSSDRDLLILPETWLNNAPQYLPGIPKIIFNQNAFYSFGLNGDCNPRTIELYQHPDIHAIVTVSNDSRNLLVEGCGVASDRCAVLINGIDQTLFHPPAIKHRRVVFLRSKTCRSRTQGCVDGKPRSATQQHELSRIATDAAPRSCCGLARRTHLFELWTPGGIWLATRRSNCLWMHGGGLSRIGRSRFRPAPHEGGGIRRSARTASGNQKRIGTLRCQSRTGDSRTSRSLPVDFATLQPRRRTGLLPENMEPAVPMTPMKRVQRYDGRDLGFKPHIAVLGSCKVGNFVVTLPLLRLLRRRYPNAQIDFWGTEATRDFEIALCGEGQPLDWRISWDQPEDNGNPSRRLEAITAATAQRQCDAGELDLVINCDGFNPLTQTLSSWLEPQWVAGGSLRADGRSSLIWGKAAQQCFLADTDWDSNAFLERYSETFTSNYIAELLCRMAYLKPTNHDLEHIDLPWANPPFITPEILIHTTTTRAAKIWPMDGWKNVLEWCEDQSHKVGLVGASPKRQQAEYHSGDKEEQLLEEYPKTLIDLRGKTSLIQLAGACKEAKAVVSVDAGPMHIAAAVGTPTLAVVGNDKEANGASPIRLWQPRNPVVERTVSTTTCKLCSENRYKNDICIAENHICMDGVSANQVIEWLEKKIK